MNLQSSCVSCSTPDFLYPLEEISMFLGSSLETPYNKAYFRDSILNRAGGKLLKMDNEWPWIILSSSDENLPSEIWIESGDITLHKLLSDSKFRVLPTHSKSICSTNYASGTDLWRAYLKEKKADSVLDVWSLKCL